MYNWFKYNFVRDQQNKVLIIDWKNYCIQYIIKIIFKLCQNIMPGAGSLNNAARSATMKTREKKVTN